MILKLVLLLNKDHPSPEWNAQNPNQHCRHSEHNDEDKVKRICTPTFFRELLVQIVSAIYVETAKVRVWLLEEREDNVSNSRMHQEDEDQNGSSTAFLKDALIGSVFNLPEDCKTNSANDRKTTIKN